MQENTEGKDILVGVQMDGEGRDLLNWVIGKFSGPGDRVTAAHVYRKSDLCNSSIISITRSLDKCLAEYEALCSAKQVALVGRLSHGNSIKKALVKEASLCSFRVVVVGVNKKTFFWGSASLAKYCAKKLPRTTSLLAVHGGKVVFERGSTKPPPGGVKPRLCRLSSRTLSMNSEVTIPESERMSTFGSMRYSTDCQNHENKMLADTRSNSICMGNVPEPTPGWPLLQGPTPMISGPSGGKLARKMSVVQWAMSLPDRCQPSLQTLFKADRADNTPGLGKASAYIDLHENLSSILETNFHNCRWFTQDELKESTSQFSSENLIGNGGCSRVYMGHLPDGQQIAVKTMKLSENTFRGFLLEAEIVTTLHHKHIVPLIGVSIEGDELISVYNFFSKGSLEENLDGKRAKSPLSWDMRFKVALGIAEALCYLHTDCPRPVIHRDIKSSNILLSNDFEPKLSDFGLAIWAPEDSSSATHNDVFGTFGYLAPEYFMYGKVSDKMDVYSFGVVLLELLTGRKPIRAESPKNQESLVMWMLEQGDLMDVLDHKIEANYDEDQMRRMVLAATVCIRRVARLRPQMSQVLSLLRREEDIESWMKSSNLATSAEEINNQDEECYPPSCVAAHLGLALEDVDVVNSNSSTEQAYQNYIEEYLRGRWSRSSSFD